MQYMKKRETPLYPVKAVVEELDALPADPEDIECSEGMTYKQHHHRSNVLRVATGYPCTESPRAAKTRQD